MTVLGGPCYLRLPPPTRGPDSCWPPPPSSSVFPPPPTSPVRSQRPCRSSSPGPTSQCRTPSLAESGTRAPQAGVSVQPTLRPAGQVGKGGGRESSGCGQRRKRARRTPSQKSLEGTLGHSPSRGLGPRQRPGAAHLSTLRIRQGVALWVLCPQRSREPGSPKGGHVQAAGVAALEAGREVEGGLLHAEPVLLASLHRGTACGRTETSPSFACKLHFICVPENKARSFIPLLGRMKHSLTTTSMRRKCFT